MGVNVSYARSNHARATIFSPKSQRLHLPDVKKSSKLSHI